MICWSYGGGIQSAAIGVLIREGVLPVPDLAVIADTGRERRTTWEYMHGVMQPYLAPTGLVIQIAPHSLAGDDLYGPSGLTLMPAYTAEGRLPAFCSGTWKRDVIERWLRLQGVKECVVWIGFSIDEIGRVTKKDHRPWCRQEFPLIDRMVNRTMCRGLITAAGLPVPSKSRCWQCPHQDEDEWSDVLADPIDGPKAIATDYAIRQNDPEQKGLFLHFGRKPLDLIEHGEGIQPPMMPCEGGSCFT